MKKISALAALLILSGCSTTPSVDETQQLAKEEAVQEMAETVTPISLTVIANPSDARVRIMNIKPVYEDAIELDEGKYDVEVSKPGYPTYRKWVVVDKKTVLTVNLDEVAATEADN